MTQRYRTLLVVSIALMTVVGMGAITVAAQNETAGNETAGNETAGNETAGNETIGALGNETGNETGPANVTFGNQTSNGTAVTVNSTTLPEGGFVAIYTVNESFFHDTATNATANETAGDLNVTENETEMGLNVTDNETGMNVTDNETGMDLNATEDEPRPGVGISGVNATNVTEVNETTLGFVVGNSSYLEAGTHENVTIMFNGRMVENQTLVAVAFQDMDGNQQWDGPENESMYMDEQGDVVADSAFVTLADTTADMGNMTAANETDGALNVTENETDGGINVTENETDGGTNVTDNTTE